MMKQQQQQQQISQSRTTSSTTEYKLDIMKRIGSEKDFENVIFSFVDRLQSDPELEPFFSTSSDSLNLAVHQEQFLRAVFLKTGSLNIHNYVLRRYCRLIDLGFNDRHFDILVLHFACALDEHLCLRFGHNNKDDERMAIIKDAIRLLNSVRYIFEKEIWRIIFQSKEEEVSLLTKANNNSSRSLVDATC